MDGIKKFLAPLAIFVVGMIGILVVTVFFPAIGNSQSAASSDISSAEMSSFSGLSWALTSTRLIIFCALLIGVLFVVAIVWLKRK